MPPADLPGGTQKSESVRPGLFWGCFGLVAGHTRDMEWTGLMAKAAGQLTLTDFVIRTASLPGRAQHYLHKESSPAAPCACATPAREPGCISSPSRVGSERSARRSVRGPSSTRRPRARRRRSPPAKSSAASPRTRTSEGQLQAAENPRITLANLMVKTGPKRHR
ncbi:protein of unknown function [Bradyrhizobium sp. ORS 285]|nr:hypothetical protein BRAO285_150008 [Bradyrhizobium sp. ORS 285]SMX56444.1 protein of unknown function [Bradyrhizobium sp. ORS 285]